MKNETNQGVQGINIHDVITLTKTRKTGENGEKKGASYYEYEKIGVVMSVSDTRIKMIEPDGDEHEYKADDEDDEYYYTIARASDIGFEKAIAEKVKQQEKQVDSAIEKLEEMQEWHKTFKHQISLFGQIAHFVKGSFKE